MTRTLRIAAATMLLGWCNACGTGFNTDRWPVEEAREWYDSQGWICGFNYVPSTASNTTEFWGSETLDEATIVRELALAKSVGFNSCRVFVQYLVWKNDPESLKKRVDQFLAIAHANNITVVPVLFDDCTFGDPPITEPYLGKQRDPIPGMILPSWTPSPGLKAVTDKSAWPDLQHYVEDIVSTFGKDQRVLFWDLYNEPGNSNMGDRSLPLAEAVFRWARNARPVQPLTIAVWAEMDKMNRQLVSLSDIVSYHAYTDHAGMKAAIARHKTHGRPVICTEWMARLAGSRWDTDLPLFKQEKVGCYCWGLVNGRTQAQFPWGSPQGAPEPEVWFHDLFHKDGTPYDSRELDVIKKVTGKELADKDAAPAPLFVDPVYDGAADPTLVWNHEEQQWWIFYTSRRANRSDEPGVRWCHQTDIGIAASTDGGQTWNYKGVAQGLAFEEGPNTWWAPEVIRHENLYHMFISYVPGVHEDWSGERHILHYTSGDLLQWKYEGRIPLSSNNVIDPCVFRFPDGAWRMWYKDEADGSHIYLAESSDLFAWKVAGPAESSRGQEAPNVFRLGGYYWLLTDSGGLSHYRSTDGLAWEYRGPFMQQAGSRRNDNYVAQHPDVVVFDHAAYIIYFVHPYGKNHVKPTRHRSVLQAAKLEVQGEELIAVRDEPFSFQLTPKLTADY